MVKYVSSHIYTYRESVTHIKSTISHQDVDIHPCFFHILSEAKLVYLEQALGRLQPLDLLWVATLPAAGEVRRQKKACPKGEGRQMMVSLYILFFFFF